MTSGLRFRLPGRRHSLHADDGGQISALAVMGAAIFASLLALVINTGAATSQKIELQNAADASALSGAAWIARGMNIVSMNNVTQSQLFAIVMIIPALDRAIDAAKIALQIQINIARAFSWNPIGAGILVALEIQYQALLVYEGLVGTFVPMARDNGLLWQAMRMLRLVSDGVRASFPAIGLIEANRIARENGAEGALLVPAGFNMVLPIRAGRINPDLCDPTRRGSPGPGERGYTPLLGDPPYSYGRGPFEVYSSWVQIANMAFVNTLLPVWFSGARQLEYAQRCAAPGEEARQTVPARSLMECRSGGGGTAQWQLTSYNSIRFAQRRAGFGVPPDPASYVAGEPSRTILERSCSWTPPGSPAGSGQYRDVVERRYVAGMTEEGIPRYEYSYTAYDYAFIIAAVSRTVRGEQSQGGADSDEPSPYLLGTREDPTPDGARKLLHYFAVTYRERDAALAQAHFIPALGTRRLTYAQARVYNPTAFDMFTQDWRVTLEPASMLDNGSAYEGVPAGSVLGRAGGLLSRSFGGLMSVLNNH